jgi:SAM-dependent methyltransferase
MSTYDPTAYGAAAADDYDECYGGDFYDTAGAIHFLVDLAGPGPVLELGIGTGRLALPLRQAGLAVHGIDASDAMVARLRVKPGGDAITVTVADFSAFEVDDRFSLAVLAVNTIFALPSQDAQVRCFRCVAGHLSPGGRFVVEAFVPNPARFRDGESIRIRTMTSEQVTLDIARIDPAKQFMHTTQVHLRNGTVSLHPANHRYAWPAELDLIARLGGLDLEDRWEDWHHTPFTGSSRSHVSVYRKPLH